MIKTFALLLLMLVVVSCTNAEKDVIGIYKAENKIGDRVRYYSFHMLSGSTLNLKSDSTFKYTTCGMVNSGKWKKSGDSILLLTLNKKFKNDSLNYSDNWRRYLVPSKTAIGFKLNNGRLESQVISKGKAYVEILYK